MPFVHIMKTMFNNYYGFTVHDRFFMHVAQSYKLYSILKVIYKSIQTRPL
jgi:hypothetical protein